MLRTLQLAVRTLGHAPGFAAVAVLTLALGIGLSASSFSLANIFLLRNLPYPEADRIVRVFVTSRQSPRDGLAPGNALDIRAAATSFRALALYHGDMVSFGEPGRPAEQVNALLATTDFLDVIGVQPAVGRNFAAGEDQVEQPPVVILTHRCWIRRFAGEAGVIGRVVRLNAQPYTVIGILPPRFDAPLVWGPLEFILPRSLHPEFRDNRTDRWMQLVGRLAPGVSLRQAQAELDTLARQLEKSHPKENEGRGLRLEGLAHSNMDSVSRSLLWLMTGLALAMLLIACANLASLQVARAFVRSREFAVRAALGGSRRQLMAPLLTESLVLALAGGGAGLLVASWSNDLIGRLLLVGDEPGLKIPIDGRVLAFAAFSSLLSGLAFGLAPAWLSGRAPAAEALKEGARSATGNPSHQKLKRILVVGELAVALTLVGVAAAFGVGAKSFLRRDVGWSVDGLFAGYLALPYEPYGADGRTEQFYEALLPKLAMLPGVQQAAVCRNLPMYSLGPVVPLTIEGQTVSDAATRPWAQVATVSSGYFAALQVPVLRGQAFADHLPKNERRVGLINQTGARQLWPHQDPIGRRVKLGADDEWMEIIGVVGDVGMLSRFTTLETPLQLYRPIAQAPTRYVAIVLRTAVPPDVLTEPARAVVASIDGDLPIAGAGSLRAMFERNLSNLNLVIVNLALSAGMGLVIAAVGLFGVISQLTVQRTRDIGVRMALGAADGHILKMILAEGVQMLALGIVFGVPSFFAFSAILRRALPAMELPGPWLLVTNIVVLGLTMLLACWLPARRATRINPIEALRAE